VSASGKIQPKSNVNISAETMGKVVSLTVNEGDVVKIGQELLQIDPKNLETNVQNREASLATQLSQLEQTKAQIENAKVALTQAQETLKRSEAQWAAGGLISKDALERAQNDVKMQTTNFAVAEQSVKTRSSGSKSKRPTWTAQNTTSRRSPAPPSPASSPSAISKRARPRSSAR
jgi:HlyD family secretion protein